MNDIVFLVDVDNTLIDNDGVREDFRSDIAQAFGTAYRDRYWDDPGGLVQSPSAIATIWAPRSNCGSIAPMTWNCYPCRPIYWIIRSPTASIPVRSTF